MMNAETTVKQLGGFGKLKAMVGASNFVKDENSLSFKFKGNRKMSHVTITLNSRDEYDVKFLKITMGKTFKRKVVSTTQAHAGNLKKVFEQETGLYLSL